MRTVRDSSLALGPVPRGYASSSGYFDRRSSVHVLSEYFLRLLLDLETESVIELLPSTAQCEIPKGLNRLN